MGKIGSFGNLAFSVSDKTVKTFDGMSWKVSAKYATHDRHLKEDLLEFLGPEPGSISFSMKFSVFLGTNPLKEVKKLQTWLGMGRRNAWCWAARFTAHTNGYVQMFQPIWKSLIIRGIAGQPK